MSFQALARTWRPRRFDQLVGQEHVVRALTHALDNNKLHHALLFSGTRGVGKTTLARIIAKCLNCERGVSSSPCVGDDACSTCREIDEGRYVDLIEVDAASRTGVDDTRELMDNVQYAPTRGRTKVYLIDEVHMLTKHSFNALLKTLEEPPPRVQFLLATTEPEKIPVTILSRCLQFPLKRLSATRIAERLRYIVDAESLSADDEALTELARGADGSMRDGLSLLDQAVAFGGGHLDVDGVRDMLGTIGEARVAELVDAVIDAHATNALIALESLYAQGIDMRYLLEALATAWQHIATVQVVGEAVDDDSARWQPSAERLDPRVTQLFYDITVAGIRDLPHAPDPLIGVRMAVLRMLAFAPAGSPEPGGTTPPPAEKPSRPAPPGAAAVPGDRKQTAREAMARARAQLQGNKQPGATDSARAAETAAPPHAANTTSTSAREEDLADPGAAERATTSVLAPPTPPSAAEARAVSIETAPAGSQTADGAGVAPAPAEAQTANGDTHVESAPNPSPGAAGAGVATPDGERPTDVSAAVTFDFASTRDHPEDWHALVPRLAVRGFAAQLANNGVCRHLDNERIELELARANAFLATDDAREQLQAALAEAWATSAPPQIRINVVDELHDTPAQRIEADAEKRQQDAVASIENDPIIQQLRSQLGARLRPETIKPHRSPGAMQQREEQ